MQRMAAILMLTAVISAATPVMTNATIEAMVSGGVPLPVIVRAIKTATKIELLTGDQDYARLTNAGASTSAADEIMKAIHYREYVGIDRSPVKPLVPAAVVAKPAPVPVASVAPAPVPVVSVPVPPAAPVPVRVTTSFPPVPVTVPVPPAPVSVPVAVPSPWSPPIPLPPMETRAGSVSPVPPGPVLSAHGPELLTDSEVTDAILKARLNGRHRIGLMLNDVQTSWASVLVPQGAVSGYTIFVYTPEQWIEQLAVNAKREILPFTADSATPEMRLRMLHVVAMPSTPEYLNGTGFALASSVHRIVITDTARNEIIQPMQLTNGSVTTNSALRSA